MRKKGISIKERRTLNPAVCLLLSAVMAFSSVVTYFADDSISSGDRIVRLTTKDIDGNFTNNDDASKNKYELEIQKTLNTPNELCFEYNVSDFATADDIASEVELVMPNVSFKDSILTVNDANTIIGDPSVVTEGSTARLLMRLNREYVAGLDKIVINIPFKITKLSDIGDVVINLKSASNQVISYTWNTVLVDTIENPQDLPEFDRFNNGTYFKNASMKVAKGLYHKIPVRVLSKGNEGETLITLEHPSFYFKNYDGTWTLGQGTMKVTSLTALSSKVVDFEVFQIEDSTTPMKLKVNNTNLTSTMQLEPTRIILDTSPTVTTVKVGETNTIDATLKLETPFTANNSFKINIGADSNKFEFSNLEQGTGDNDNKSMQFLLPFKTKKAFNSGIISLEVVTEFQGQTYEIISKDLTFVSNDTSTPIDPDPIVPETKDYYVSSLQAISSIKNGASKNATFNIVNNSNNSAQIKVKIKSSDSNVTVDSTHLGFNVESSTEYTITATVDANSSLMIPYSITANKNANTGTTDKTNSLTFTILTADDVTSNNEQTLYYVVNPNTTTNPDPVEPDPIDYYVEDLPAITPVNNGDTRSSLFTLVNNSNEDASIKVKIKSSDTRVSIESIHAGFQIEGNNEYSITANVKANSSVKIPYSLVIGKTANDGTTTKQNTLTFTIVTQDDVTSNNTKTLTYTVKPDEAKPDPIDPDPIEPETKDYYVNSLSAITAMNNGGSKNATFNVVNNSKERATINVNIKSSDSKVALSSTHNGFSKINETEYSVSVTVDANSSVTVPYTLTAAKDANTSTTDKQNILTFAITTQDDITSNNTKTLTYTIKPDETTPDPIDPETKDYYVNNLSAITAMNNGGSRNATFNVVNNSNERATIRVSITSSDSNVTLSSTHSGFSKVNPKEYTLTVTVDANSSAMIPYAITVAKDANTSTIDKQNTLVFSILTADDITSNNTKTLTYTIKPDETTPDPINPEPTTKDYYFGTLSSIASVNNGGSRNATFNVVNNSNERASIMLGVTSSDSKVTLSSTHDNFSKVNSKEYRFTVTVEANSSIMIPYSIDVAKDANVGTSDKTNSLTFTILTSDDVTNNNEKVLYYTITPDTIVTPEPVIKDYYVGSLSSIVPVANGASKNSTFNVVNNSDEAATINVNIVSSDPKVTLSSTHEGFAKIGASEYSLMVDVDANSSVMIPYSITVAKDANTGTTDKRNTLTFSIITPDDITSNNVKTLSYIVAPDPVVTPDPTPDEPDPTPTTIDLNQYFAINLITDRTPELNKEVTVAISANKLKDLTTLVENPKVELVVTGPSLKDNPSGTYKITKNLPYIETSVLSSQNISFTPLAEGTYTVTAKITGTNLNGILTAQKQITIVSGTGAAPSNPIIGSGKVFVTVDLIDIHDNEATLKVTVTNATDYLLRNVSLSLSYDAPVTISLSPVRSIMKDFYIGEMNKNSTKEFTFPVKINSTGKPNIVVSLNSTDLNLDVYTPRASYNTLVTYIAEQEEPEKRYKVSGIVFDDINGDGLYSSSDQPISSATVHLKGKVGNIVQTMFSYTSGYYSFSNIVPGDYTIEVNYMGLTSKKKITITDEEQINANIPVLYTYNNTNKPSNPSNPGNTPNTPSNPSISDTPGNSNSSNNNNNQQTFYKDVSLIGSLRSNGNNSYIIDLQVSNTNSLPVTDATLKVTAYHTQLQSSYDYIRTSDNSYIIHVPTFISLKELPLYFSAESENARVMIELVCPTDSNTSNNTVSFTLNSTSNNTTISSNVSSNDSNDIVRGTLKKKISDTEITVKVKSKTETYTLASDVIFELDDKKSSSRKINSAFNDDAEISVKLYRDASGNVYKVIASSDYDDETTSSASSENKLVDFNTTPSTPSTPSNVSNTSQATPAQSNETPIQSSTEESTQTSTIVPVSQSTEEAMYNNANVTPSLPKTGESSNVFAGLYRMISFVTGFTAVVLFVYAIMLKQKQSISNNIKIK